MKKIISAEIFGENADKTLMKMKMRKPLVCRSVNVSGYWIRQGSLEVEHPKDYVFTKTVDKNLKDLARIASAR